MEPALTCISPPQGSGATHAAVSSTAARLQLPPASENPPAPPTSAPAAQATAKSVELTTVVSVSQPATGSGAGCGAAAKAALAHGLAGAVEGGASARQTRYSETGDNSTRERAEAWEVGCAKMVGLCRAGEWMGILVVPRHGCGRPCPLTLQPTRTHLSRRLPPISTCPPTSRRCAPTVNAARWRHSCCGDALACEERACTRRQRCWRPLQSLRVAASGGARRGPCAIGRPRYRQRQAAQRGMGGQGHKRSSAAAASHHTGCKRCITQCSLW